MRFNDAGHFIWIRNENGRRCHISDNRCDEEVTGGDQEITQLPKDVNGFAVYAYLFFTFTKSSFHYVLTGFRFAAGQADLTSMRADIIGSFDQRKPDTPLLLLQEDEHPTRPRGTLMV